jgi:N-lysine methyltransferase SETD6
MTKPIEPTNERPDTPPRDSTQLNFARAQLSILIYLQHTRLFSCISFRFSTSMAARKTENGPGDFQILSSSFLEWFQSSSDCRLSAKISLTDLRSRDAGRGVGTLSYASCVFKSSSDSHLVANSSIFTDEELFAIPRSMVLQKTNSDLYLKVPEAFADLGPWDSLIIVLVYEYLRHDSSPWFPYLQLLPTTFNTLMFWTSVELSELQGSAVVNKIGKQSAEESWNITLLPIMFSNEALFPLSTRNPADRQRQLLELAHMAGSMIMAYAFDIDADDSDDSPEDAVDGANSDLTADDEENPAKGMVPFADMLNADAHRNNARLFHEDDFLIMKATQNIQAGDEILNDYGPLPRSDLLRTYGYITDNYSAYDVVEISADLIENVAASSGTDRSYLAQQVQLFDTGGLKFADKEPA